MNPIYNTYRPEGFSSVNAYLMIADPQGLIDFLKKAFYAEEIDRTEQDGIIRNCIMKIGDACFMLGQASEDFEGMRTSFYLYTNDVDALHANALENGAKEVFPPADMDYGDRQGGVMDTSGNYWWISKRLVEGHY